MKSLIFEIILNFLFIIFLSIYGIIYCYFEVSYIFKQKALSTQGILDKKLYSSFNMDQEGKIFKIYSNTCEKFQQNFHRPECLEMNNLSLKRICQANFLILFLTQYEIKDNYQCLEDQKL